MKIESAEMTKHALNAYLGLNITFANEIASLCDFYGASYSEVEKALKKETSFDINCWELNRYSLT